VILSILQSLISFSFVLFFVHSACLRFSAELFLFVIFSTFSFAFVQISFIYRLSLWSLRNHYLTLLLFIDDHDAMIVRWSTKRKRKLLKRKEEASIKLCCVVCVSLNRKKVRVAKILRAVIEFRFKKRELDVVLSDSKFDQFVLMSVICFVDLFQSEMMLSSSKKMKDDYEMMKFELSNWFDDDVEIDKANWLKDNVANFDDDDFSNWQNIRVETIQKIVFSNWLKNCVEIDEKIKEWIDVNQCDDDEKKSEKKENYKSAFEIFLSTTIIEVIIVIIIIIIIIIEKNEYEEYVDHFENFDCLFVCSVEFLDFLSSLKEEKWNEKLMFVCEESLKEKFVCVVCFFAEFVVLENVHSNCEFCDSTLIFSRLFVSEFVASFVVLSTLKNFANKTQSSESSSSAKKEEFEIEKKIVFIFCSSVYIFINLSIESLFAFVFFVFDLNFVISFERSSAFLNSKKSEIVRIKKIKFLDEKIVIENDVSNLCETNSSSFSSLDDFCVEVIKIDEKKEKKRSFFCFEFFVIDFLFDCYQNCQKKSAKKKKKKRCRLRRSINIAKVDQSRMRMMRVWLKIFLKKENCRNQRFARKKQRLSRRRSYNSDLRRQFHRYKLCRCYFVD
jgi:hypothetical protein